MDIMNLKSIVLEKGHPVEFLTYRKPPFWFTRELSYSGGCIEWFSCSSYFGFLGKREEFDPEEIYVGMYVPTSLFEILSIKDLNVKVMQKNKELPLLKLEVDEYGGITYLAWHPYFAKEDKDLMEEENKEEKFNSLISTKAVKEVIGIDFINFEID